MQLTFYTFLRNISTSSPNLRNVKPGGYSKSSLPIINKEDYAILYGLILGDAYISRKNTENAYIRFEQSIIHKDYLEHLFDKFKYLCKDGATVKSAERKKLSVKIFSVYFVTRQFTAITELHNLFYREGRKVVPFNIETLLTEESLAYWAMDDGDNHRSGYILNTCSFTLNDLNLLKLALKNNWNLDCSIHSRNRLYIKAHSKKDFIDLVKPYFHPTMLYKLN